jgi:hypothetical protein
MSKKAIGHHIISIRRDCCTIVAQMVVVEAGPPAAWTMEPLGVLSRACSKPELGRCEAPVVAGV